MALQGTCLCGAVHYEADAEPVFTGHCHCQDCQKESGGGHVTVAAVPDASFKVTGATTTYTKPGESGQPVARTFCSKCGSTVYSRPQLIAGMTLLRAGTLNDPAQVTPAVSVYTSSAVSWDPPSASLPGFPKMPPRG